MAKSLVNKDVDELSSTIAHIVVEKLTPVLRQMALDSKWPVDAVAALTISVNEDFSLSVDYPIFLKQKIEDLEYGTPFSVPNAVIRPFTLRSEAWVAYIVEQTAMDTIIEIAGII